jgi:flavin reductase (DIM6/NTAB) family NADH-FMN oxidoreductase RutF
MNLRALASPLRPLALWSPIGLDTSQSLVDVSFDAAGREFDVTGRQVVLSLAPLVIAVAHTPGQSATRARLHFRDRDSGVRLGTLELRVAGQIEGPDFALDCYAVEQSSHHCLPAPLRAWQRWLQQRRPRDQRGGFSMDPADVQLLLVFYICPRPVVLVSVDDGESQNLFPMDLVGPMGDQHFTLALRNTSPSVQTLRNAGRVVLADVPLADRALAYALGAHHRLQKIDWNALPCETVRSPRHGFRVPAQAPRVRELDIVAARQRGSHTTFLCRITAEENRAGVTRLFHTSGIHRAWRRGQGPTPWLEPQSA